MGTQEDKLTEAKNNVRRLADEVWAVAKALPFDCREFTLDLKSISTRLHDAASKLGG